MYLTLHFWGSGNLKNCTCVPLIVEVTPELDKLRHLLTHSTSSAMSDDGSRTPLDCPRKECLNCPTKKKMIFSHGGISNSIKEVIEQ